jgi:beta-glucan synthesis-associated protein KRE6
MYINRMASEETYALSTPYSSLGSGQRGSMVLYRLATEDENGSLLVPPTFPNRDSVVSSSGDSIVSLSSDSKYPQGYSVQRGLVPYAYDPALDEKEPPDEVDLLHDPGDGKDDERVRFALRGILNVGVLVLLIAGLLCLFIIYPVLKSVQDSARNKAIDDSLHINATGQSPAL